MHGAQPPARQDVMKMEKIILASGSPRRRELLELAGIPFEVVVSSADETTSARDPQEVVSALSAVKCLDVLSDKEAGTIVLGADTIVSMDGQILGKPKDAGDAARMLRMISGRTHDVFTGVTLAQKQENGSVRKETFAVRTEVTVSPLSDAEIAAYIATGEPLDKAGAYGIQGVFSRHVESIRGDYFNVVGLPVNAVYEALKRWDEKGSDFYKGGCLWNM